MIYRSVLVLVLLFASTPSLAGPAVLADLGQLPGTDPVTGFTRIYDVNDEGEFCGGNAYLLPFGAPFRSNGSTLIPVPSPPGQSVIAGEAYGINNAGDVVGYFSISSTDVRPFKWSANGGTAWLEGTSEGVSAVATDISSSGRIIGYAAIGPFGEDRAVMWIDGELVELPTPNGQSRAISINDQNQVVGVMTVDDSEHAFVWLPDPALGLPAGLTDIHSTSAGTSSAAFDINDRGQIGLRASGIPGQPGPHAARWDPDQGIVVTSMRTYFNSAPREVLITDSGDLVSWGDLVEGGTRYRFATQSVERIHEDLCTAPDEPFIYFTPTAVSRRGDIVGYTSPGSPSTNAAVVSLIRLEIVDASAEPFRDSSAPLYITTNPTRLSTNAKEAHGLAADGVTRLLLRISGFRLPAGMCVSVRADDEFGSAGRGDVGSLYQIGNEEAANPAENVPVYRVDGEELAVCVLQAPDDYKRNDSDLALPFRSLVVEVSIPGQSCPLLRTTIELHRPPVLLMHGLEDRGSSWEWRFKNHTVFAANYGCPRTQIHCPHSRRFVRNAHVVERAIQSALFLLRRDGIAATQVDAIGHSMGGSLLRMYSLDTVEWDGRVWPMKFLRDDNFGRGDLHKLITVNTPHRGSAISNALVTRNNVPKLGGILAAPLVLGLARCSTCGAVADLRTDSEIIEYINTTASPVDIPVHAIAGSNDGRTFANEYWGRTEALLRLGCSQVEDADEFFGGPSDAVVSLRSQLGRLRPPQATIIRPETVDRLETCFMHSPIMASPICAEAKAKQTAELLLDAKIGSEHFRPTGFPTVEMYTPEAVPECIPLLLSPVGVFRLILDGVREEVMPGDFVAVTIDSEPGFEPDQVFISASDGLLIKLAESPLPGMFEVPSDWLGVYEIQAVGVDPIEGVAVSDPVSIRVLPIGLAHSLVFPQSTILMTSDAPQIQVRAEARFADGVRRRINDPADVGLLFMSHDPSIASVDEQGVVHSHMPGVTFIEAMLDGQVAQIEITVDSIAGDATGDGLIAEDDLITFLDCYSGMIESANELPDINCLSVFDHDFDGDVDCQDWEQLALRWSGSALCPEDPLGCRSPCLDPVSTAICPRGGGLRGDYFLGTDLQHLVMSRVDPSINYDWGNGSPTRALPDDGFSVRWHGEIRASISGEYRFRTTSDDGVRLWIDGALLIDQWIDQPPMTVTTAITLKAGTYPIEMTHYESGGGAIARLMWLKPSSGVFEVVPSTALQNIGRDCDGNDIQDDCDIQLTSSADANGNGVLDRCEHILFVDASAKGGGRGTSWTDAFTDLQDAFDIAASDRSVRQIWIAGGRYTPDQGSGDRSRAFRPRAALEVYGGFAGTEDSTAQRIPDSPATILSGDLNGDDGPGFQQRTDNSFHVLEIIGSGSSVLLDGLTIQGGQADGAFPNDTGGGIRIEDASPVIRDCIIRDNSARFGAGLECYNYASPLIQRCRLYGNSAAEHGGAMNIVFNSSPTIESCEIFGNEADRRGGAMRIEFESESFITNCSIVSNQSRRGAGMYVASATPTLVNSIVWFNRHPNGSGGAVQQVEDNCTECDGSDGPLIEYSNLEEWYEAGAFGNIAEDPQFVMVAPAGLVSAADAVDLRLILGSACIDAGWNETAAGGATDLYGNPRRTDAQGITDTGLGLAPIVDMGAFESTGDGPCPGDMTGDLAVSFADLNAVLDGFGTHYSFEDLDLVLGRWGTTCD